MKKYLVLVTKHYASGPSSGLHEEFSFDDKDEALAECHFQKSLISTTRVALVRTIFDDSFRPGHVQPVADVV